MTASDIAAWWGAGLATLVLAWDVYKWKTSGARLSVKVVPGMQMAGDRTGTLHILVEVVNRGDRLTTLTHLAVYQYASSFDRLRKKRQASLLVPKPGGNDLPYELEPGKRWTGLMDQAGLIKQLEGNGQYLHVAVIHSGSNRDHLVPLSVQTR
jgi:hypothetical protein